DPARYRLFMLPAVLEKLTFSIVTLILFSQHRATGELLGFGLIDLCLGILFLVAFLRTQPANEPTS
ncbi:MAG: hypothetical protein O2954_00985, partial [bacterium]|nr:hypothetical protein [bacterium]